MPIVCVWHIIYIISTQHSWIYLCEVIQRNNTVCRFPISTSSRFRFHGLMLIPITRKFIQTFKKIKKIHRQEPNLILKKSPFSSLSSFACQVFQFFFFFLIKKRKKYTLDRTSQTWWHNTITMYSAPTFRAARKCLSFFFVLFGNAPKFVLFNIKSNHPKKKKGKKSPPYLGVRPMVHHAQPSYILCCHMIHERNTPP